MQAKTRLTPLIALIAVISLLGSSAAASDTTEQNPYPVLDEVIVSARGIPSQISATPGGSAIIDHQQLLNDQPVSITNSLEQLIPGVEKSSDSAWGSSINIRGMGRNRVLFLIDGTRVNTATDVNAQFGLIDPADIERIEVLKGPISALYGSGSIGGVVNVITTQGSPSQLPGLHGSLLTGVGTNARGYRSHASLDYSGSKGWLSLSAGTRVYDDYRDGNGDEVENSQWQDTSYNIKAGYAWNSDHNSSIQLQRVEAEDVGIPGKGLSLPEGPDITYPETTRTLVQLSHQYSPTHELWSESDFSLYYQFIKRRVQIDAPNAMVDSILTGADHTTYGFKWRNHFTLSDHQLSSGIDVWNWGIESKREYTFVSGLTAVNASLADADQLSAGVFGEDNWIVNKHFTLNIGGRIDLIRSESDELYDWIEHPVLSSTLKQEEQSNNDTSWNAHAGLTWHIDPAWSMTVITASSYRTPDLMDRYKYIALGGGNELYGNPDLDPERSLFAEYGLHFSTSTLKTSASAWINRVDDLITDELVSSGIYQMENIEDARLYGFELEARYLLNPELSLYANAAYTRGKNATADQDLSFIAPFNGVVGIALQPELGWRSSLDLNWATRQSKVATGEQETPGWVTLDGQIGYRFIAGSTIHDISANVENLLDKDYRNHLSTSRGIELNEAGINAELVWKVEF